MNKANQYIFGGLLIFVILLFVAGLWIGQGSQASNKFWAATKVACLPLGHQNLEVHIHPVLTLSVNGQNEVLPADIGITSDCMAEIHTHDESGQIHIESLDGDKARKFTLGDFFAVWNKPIEREGFESEVTVNGEKVEKPAELILKDLDQIKITYTSSSTQP